MKKDSPREGHSFFQKLDHALHQDSYQPSNSLLASLLVSLSLNIYAKDREGRFIYANSSYCKNVGKTREDILGKNDFEIHPTKLAYKYRKDDEQIMNTRLSASIEEPWQSIGGSRGYIQVIKSPLFSHMNQDEVIGTVGMFWDITDRKQAEIELAEERNLLRTLIDSLPDYIYVKDTESRFVLANRSVSRVMGAINPDDVIGKTDLDFYSPEEAKKFLRDEQQVIQKEIPFYDREENFVAGGSNIWCLSSKMPLKNIEGEVIGLIGIGHDITQRKKADEDRLKLEAQLHQAQKMETVGTLVAGIAHDFNNHLNVINGFSEMLCMQTSKTDSNYQLLERITQAGRSAAALIRQLMAFSRKQVAQSKVLNINHLLEDTANLLKPLLGETIELRMNLSQSLRNVKIDPTQMEQVIVNIAANAKDAMAEGGVLQIMTANTRLDEKAIARMPELETGEYVLLLMADSGCGMDKETAERIFEPFFTTKEKYKGSGLGLATVLGIVQQNGGAVIVDSSQGRGSTFQIYLPVVLEEEEPSVRIIEEDLESGGETILISEDEDNVRAFAAMVLASRGYQIICAGNGQEALERAATHCGQIDLLLTDIIMPGISGRELASRLLEKHNGLKVLFMSGYTDDALTQYDLDNQDVAFIEKPFELKALLRAVRHLLDSQGEFKA